MTNEDKQVSPPKVFISYSWTSEEHKEWVLQLATELAESGVDVVLDQWDLKEGADKYKFMEQMVNDPEVSKVLIISDMAYAKKADSRKGGVGTESQIISKEMYEQVDPAGKKHKFACIVTEEDGDGNRCLPVYAKSRIYFDMASETLRNDNFEQLVRWIYDKPLHVKPQIGSPPSYIVNGNSISLGTSALFRQLEGAVRQGKPQTKGLCQDYFDRFSSSLTKFRVKAKPDQEFDDLVWQSIEESLPYRNELCEAFSLLIRYGDGLKPGEIMFRFLESILSHRFWGADQRIEHQWELDSLKFIIHEIFLCAAASLIKEERFGAFQILTNDYFCERAHDEFGSQTVPFSCFRFYPESLAHRNKRLNNPKRLSLQADLLKNRAEKCSFLNYSEIMQADFILFLVSLTRLQKDTCHLRYWFPDSLLYSYYRSRVFEKFARSESVDYFNRFKVAMGLEEKKELEAIIQAASDQRLLPRWDGCWIKPECLSGIQKIGTRP